MRDAQHSVHLVAAIVGGVSYGLLWLSVVAGVVLRAGWALTRVRHATLYGTHQIITLLGLCLGVVHALTQLAVPAGPTRWLDEVVPFTNHRDPVGVGFGVLALEVMLALALSVLIQRRLGYHRWRRLHSLAYLAFTLLSAHLVISGSDLRGTRLRLLVGAVWATTVLLWIATTARIAGLPRALSERIAIRLHSRHTTVNVDPARCIRFGFCAQEAPEVFQLRPDGQLSYRSSIPADQVEALIRAARACPVRAVMLSRQPTVVLMPGPPTAGPGSGARNNPRR